MKNIMLLVHSDDGQEARLQCALDVTRAVGGHLNCLDIAATPILYEDYMANYGQLMLMEDVIAAERANRAKLEPRLVKEGVPFTWLDTTGNITESIVDQARLNDLVVVGSHGERDADLHGDVAKNIVRRVGRPVLAVPHAARRIDLFGTAMVAWDGSPPAEAALRAAVPLLRMAEKTIIMSVGEECGADDAAVYCSREGISARVETLPQTALRVDEALIKGAEARDVAWVVMGAYGHSPLREAVFGGVTRRMLAHAPMPLFIAAAR
jgi:nucleotide-binding universal stress UspA family protein